MLINNDTMKHQALPNSSERSNNTFQLTTNMTICLQTKAPVYDHQGAMRFTVAVVLVYGIGVIGILGIYVRRKPSETQERDVNLFVKGLRNYREQLEKKKQLSSVHDLIKSIHGDKWRYSPCSTAPSTPLLTPEAGLLNLSSKQHGVEGRPVASPGSTDNVSLMSGYRRPALARGFSSYTMDRQDSIQETREEEENGIDGTNGSQSSSTEFMRPTFSLRLPTPRFKLVATSLDADTRGDNSNQNGSPASDNLRTKLVGSQSSASSCAKSTVQTETEPEPKTNGRFTVVNVHEESV